MSARFFLDTNVFLYTFDLSARLKARQADRLIREGIETGRGVISFQVIQEFFNVALRRFEFPMGGAEAQRYLSSVFHSFFTVQSSLALYADGLRLNERYKLSWYDSIIVAAALEGQCSVLYSEDFQAGQRFGSLEIVNPFK